MVSLGIDSGSTMTKGVLYNGDGIQCEKMVCTSSSPRKALYDLYESFDSDQIVCTVTTGYGRALLKESDKKITEITCHARGSRYFEPACAGVIDIGGQDCKVIAMDESGHIIDFLMNDKCAAGTGRFMDVMMGILEEDLNDLDNFVRNSDPHMISSMCTVFAETEIISLLANDIPKDRIAMGVVHAIAKRTANFFQRLNVSGPVFFSGGLSKSEIFCRVLESYLEQSVKTHPLGQYTGALGAAIIGYESVK